MLGWLSDRLTNRKGVTVEMAKAHATVTIWCRSREEADSYVALGVPKAQVRWELPA